MIDQFTVFALGVLLAYIGAGMSLVGLGLGAWALFTMGKRRGRRS